MEVTKQDVIEYISNLSILELGKLVKELEDKFGVSAQPVLAVGEASGGGKEEEVERQTEFDVVLSSMGDKKINVIKAVRTLMGSLGLKEAKDLVESAPVDIKKAVSEEEAKEAKDILEKAGAKVEIK